MADPARARKLAVRIRQIVSAAEAGHLDLHRRSLVGVAVVAADRGHCLEVLDACERQVLGHPEIELLSSHREFYPQEDGHG